MPNNLRNGEARWRQDFPVSSDADSYATRREFTKFLGLTSVAFLFGTFVAAARSIWRRWLLGEAARIRVAAVSDVPVGGVRLFRYPSGNDPSILIRRNESEFVAFSQNCSHLACPVHLDSEGDRLLCPCHVGVFSAADGRPLAGPPRRGLERFSVEVRGGEVWVGPPARET
jgi:nitrite reductase/ring-hydroxylating ferredoxin subunit